MEYRTALVTGASSGIGRGLSERLSAAGTTVVLCARRENELREAASAIEAAGGRARIEPLDVTDTTRTVRVIREVDEALGGLDLVIANAGVGAPSPRERLSWEALEGQCHLNFCGAAATLTAVLPRMVERGRGHIVGVSSLAAIGPLPSSAAYCAAKAGLSMLIECLRIDLLGTGVHATAVHPGFVRTAMTARNPFPMPFIMDVNGAVERIVTDLPKKPATIDFPAPLAWVARAGARIPRAVRDLMMKRGLSSMR